MGNQEKEKEAGNYLYPPVPNNFRLHFAIKYEQGNEGRKKGDRITTAERSFLLAGTNLPHPLLLGSQSSEG